MRAAVMRSQRLVVDTLADPEPGPGEVLVRTLACGICGSDLHVLAHLEAIVEDDRHSGSALGAGMDPARDVVGARVLRRDRRLPRPERPATLSPLHQSAGCGSP